MANRTASLVWRCKTENGWRMFPALMGKNGRPRKGYVEVGDPPAERHYPEGYFQVRSYQGKRTVLKNVGTDANRAMVELNLRGSVLKAHEHAAESNGAVQIIEDPQRRTLAKTYAAFLQAAEDRGSPEARIVYRTAVDEFFQVIRKTYVDELVAEDMLVYQRHLRKRGLGDRTVYNRWNNTKAFFIYCGFDPQKMPTEDREERKLAAPKYEEKTVEVYGPEEIRKFFSAVAAWMKGKDLRTSSTVKDYHRLNTACQIMLKCGLRDQEVRHLEWPNVSLTREVLHVRGNPHYNFKIKDHEQRDVNIPKDLVGWLRKYRALYPHDRLVCPTRTGKPNTKLLLLMKRAAYRAGVNCGTCETCKEKNECERWYLHKFRATCITLWLRSKEMGGGGLDLRTVMELSGHSELASVMRYLSPADNDSVRRSVNGIVFGD